MLFTVSWHSAGRDCRLSAACVGGHRRRKLFAERTYCACYLRTAIRGLSLVAYYHVFERRTTRRFEAHSCKLASGCLLPSLVQHRELALAFVTPLPTGWPHCFPTRLQPSTTRHGEHLPTASIESALENMVRGLTKAATEQVRFRGVTREVADHTATQLKGLMNSGA